MSTPTIPAYFRRTYAAEVHAAFQRKTSLLRPMVRSGGRIQGKSLEFRLFGETEMGEKTRNGNIPVDNPEHAVVRATLRDFYRGTHVDSLDLDKFPEDERMELAEIQGYAAARKIDSVIITDGFARTPDGTSNTLDRVITAETAASTYKDSGTAANEAGIGSAKDWYYGLTPLKIIEGMKLMDNADAPMSERCLVTSVNGYYELMRHPEFVNADFRGDNKVPYSGQDDMNDGMARMVGWLNGLRIFAYTGLAKDEAFRESYLFHKSAVGFGVGTEPTQDVWWDGNKQGFLVATRMSVGATLIDAEGIVKIRHVDDAQLRPYVNATS